MATENDFLAFAAGAGANVLTQAQYQALSAVLTGFQSGVASSAAFNKAIRQSSIIAAMIAQFIVDTTGQAAIDDGTIATLEANLGNAIKILTRGSGNYADDTGTANAYAVTYAPAVASLFDGMRLCFKAAHANTGASTFAPNGVAASPIYGAAHQPLQGGEIVANGDCEVMWNSSLNSGNGAWVLLGCTGGAAQVGAGAQSNQAVNLGQLVKMGGSISNGSGVTSTSTTTSFTASQKGLIFIYAQGYHQNVQENLSFNALNNITSIVSNANYATSTIGVMNCVGTVAPGTVTITAAVSTSGAAGNCGISVGYVYIPTP